MLSRFTLLCNRTWEFTQLAKVKLSPIRQLLPITLPPSPGHSGSMRMYPFPYYNWGNRGTKKLLWVCPVALKYRTGITPSSIWCKVWAPGLHPGFVDCSLGGLPGHPNQNHLVGRLLVKMQTLGLHQMRFHAEGPGVGREPSDDLNAHWSLRSSMF